ncbi:MAG: response regulator receiver modulated diguanylate cyclase [Candidatus Rokubacteria bacterium CSP1-6]|nr:MAG: response regulator receiver modulated diguanylate cyclase [Candidatus Rokubacteria bacterium CSP1-6]
MRPPRLSWLQGFLLASAALISAVVIVSGLAVGWFFEHHVLTHEEEHAVNVVQSQARQHLVPADFDLPRWSGARKVFEAFAQELPGIFRIKVYDRTGRLVWSDEPRLIGKTFPADHSLENALRGNVATVLKGSAAEAYVPVTFPQAAGVVGVIETYRDVTQVVLEIRRTQRLIWGAGGGMGLLLYVALGLIVWKASVKEQRAIVEKERLAAAGQVVVGLHHEILNPLTGVLGALQVLKQDGIAQPEKAEALAEAEAAIRKIEQLIRRLPTLRRAASTAYVGVTTMLDLERSCAEEEHT